MLTPDNRKIIDALQNTAEYLESIIALMPGHVYWKDRNGVLLGCNDEQARSIGLTSRHDIVGLTAYDTLPKELADSVTHVDAEVMNLGIPQTVEEVLVLSNGEKSIWLSKKVPLRNKENIVIGILGISFDVTEKKRTEQELQEVHHKLDGMTIVSASIAHELRTPLASLNIGASTLQKFFPDLLQAYRLAEQANLLERKMQENYLALFEHLPDSMKSETKGALAFIDMLLMNVNPVINEETRETCSMVACVSEALNRYPFKKNQKKLVRWDANNDFVVRGKDLLVIHILFNLIKNALYYIAKAHKGDISIWLELGKADNLLYFKDTGTGISKEILPHIFERFYSKTQLGAGIGLTFCNMVMESLKGKITCESVEGDYTLFTLYFPASIDKN